MHHCFDTDGLAVARWAIIDDATLPWDLQLFVCLSAVEKVLHVSTQGLLHVFVEDHVVPAGLLHGIVQLSTLLPITLIKHPDFVVQLYTPLCSISDQLVYLVRIARKNVVVLDHRVVARAISTLSDVQYDLLVFPFVHELAKGENLSHEATPAVKSPSCRYVLAPFQAHAIHRVFGAILEWRGSREASRGICEKVQLSDRRDDQLELGILCAQRFDKYDIGVDAFRRRMLEVLMAREVRLGGEAMARHAGR